MLDKITYLIMVEPLFYRFHPQVYENLTMSAMVMLSDVEYFGMKVWRG